MTNSDLIWKLVERLLDEISKNSNDSNDQNCQTQN